MVTFQGITREVERLDYEAYAEMAERRIVEILTELHERSARGDRGRAPDRPVPLGEPSVIVAASSAHRPEAFTAAREAIDRIKAEAPIWKREVEGEEGTMGRGNDSDDGADPSRLPTAPRGWSTSAPSPRPRDARSPRLGSE